MASIVTIRANSGLAYFRWLLISPPPWGVYFRGREASRRPARVKVSTRQHRVSAPRLYWNVIEKTPPPCVAAYTVLGVCPSTAKTETCGAVKPELRAVRLSPLSVIRITRLRD